MEHDDDIQLVIQRPEGQRAPNEEYDHTPPVEDWKPRRQETLIMTTLSLISLMVALDASILVPALPVSFVPTQGMSLFPHSEHQMKC